MLPSHFVLLECVAHGLISPYFELFSGIAEAITSESQKHHKKAQEDNDSMSGVGYEEEDEDQNVDDDVDDDDDDVDVDDVVVDDDDDVDDEDEDDDEKYDENYDKNEDEEKQSNFIKDDNEYRTTGENYHTVKGVQISNACS